MNPTSRTDEQNDRDLARLTAEIMCDPTVSTSEAEEMARMILGAKDSESERRNHTRVPDGKATRNVNLLVGT